MKTENLYCFIKVCEAGSLNKASEMLNISAQGLGKIIKKLEEEIGTVLLNRTAQGLSLTEHGRLLYDNICDVLRAENKLVENAAHLVNAKAERKCILGNTDVFRRMAEILRDYSLSGDETIIPVIFTGSAEELESEFLTGDYDYCGGILECVRESSALPYETIFRMNYMYAVNENSKLTELDAISPADLDGCTLLYEDPDSLIIKRIIKQSGDQIHELNSFKMRHIADRLRIIRDVSVKPDSVFLANGATFPYIRQMKSIVLKPPVSPLTFTAIFQTKLSNLDKRLCSVLKEGVLEDLKGIPIE